MVTGLPPAGVAEEVFMSLAVSTRAPAPPRNVAARLVMLLMALLTGALVISGCSPSMGERSPINPANRPTTIAGYSNGYLPASQLYVVNSKCTMYRAAVGSFEAMVAAARADGVTLGTAECYRNYAGQVYERKYWCARKLCANAATPGYSNHGWGKAVDFVDAKGSLNWTSAGYRWLVAHAGEYGWNHPGGVNEAWHWEWVGDGGTMHGYGVRVDLMTWAK
jgi:D-alanyl-D-alanine carboxypeptidase